MNTQPLSFADLPLIAKMVAQQFNSEGIDADIYRDKRFEDYHAIKQKVIDAINAYIDIPFINEKWEGRIIGFFFEFFENMLIPCMD